MTKSSGLSILKLTPSSNRHSLPPWLSIWGKYPNCVDWKKKDGSEYGNSLLKPAYKTMGVKISSTNISVEIFQHSINFFSISGIASIRSTFSMELAAKKQESSIADII